MTDDTKQDGAAESQSASKAMLGFCPSCNRSRESLPAPAEGTCPVCFNHLLEEMTLYDHWLALHKEINRPLTISVAKKPNVALTGERTEEK